MKKTDKIKPDKIEELEKNLDKKIRRREKKKVKKMKVTGRGVFELDKIMTKK